MKKYRKAFLLIAVLMLLAIIPSKNLAFAEDIEYKITDYTINADIQTDSSVTVTEYLTYDFDSSANGVYRDINYLNPDNPNNSATAIDQIVVYEAGLTEDTLNEYVLADASTKNGDRRVYTIQPNENGIRLKIYCPIENQQKRFVIQYRLVNAVASYLDTADFYWNFIGKEWETDLNNVSIVITLPEATSKLKVFSHGPLSGKHRILDQATVQYENNKLDAGDAVSVRILFPTDILTTAKKLINETKLGTILSQEKQWAIEANRLRNNESLTFTLLVLYIIIGFAMYILLYRKYGRRENVFHGIVTEPPSSFGPAFAEYITKHENIGASGATAELFNLMRKKYISIAQAPELQSKGKAKNNIVFLLNNAANTYEYKHEAFLIDWFFHVIGNGETVSLDDIKKYSRKNVSKFNKSYTAFKKLMKAEALEMGLYSEKTPAYKVGLLFFLFSAGTGVIMVAYSRMYFFAVLVTIISLLLLLLTSLIKQPTKELSLEREKWKAYKKFIKQITIGDTTKASDYSLVYWEQAFLFAIIFGIHKNTLAKLRNNFVDADFCDTNLTFLHTHDGMNNSISSVTNAVNSTISNLSSTSGFSGGSSAGGASSGGGGGGGGAF